MAPMVENDILQIRMKREWIVLDRHDLMLLLAELQRDSRQTVQQLAAAVGPVAARRAGSASRTWKRPA